MVQSLTVLNCPHPRGWRNAGLGQALRLWYIVFFQARARRAPMHVCMHVCVYAWQYIAMHLYTHARAHTHSLPHMR